MKRIKMTCISIVLVLLAAFGVPALLLGGRTRENVYAAKEDYSKCYTVSGQDIKIKSGYENKDITAILNAALEKARDTATAEKPVTVTVPKGTYKLTSNLRIFSNTTLVLKGVTLKYAGTESHVMLQSGTNGSYMGETDYNQSKKCAAYKGFENITIKGGTFQSIESNTGSIMRIAHAKNVTLDGITFKEGGCAHQVEVAAINGFYVKNCKFIDWDGPDTPEEGYEDEKYEALQLDIPCSTRVFRNVYQDGTVMKNVEVTGCTFSNVPRGVGTHTFLLGAYHENIKINKNTFKNVAEEAIICLGYKNSEVKDNTIKDCGAGILFQYFKANTYSVYTTTMDGKKKFKAAAEHDSNSIISGNKITIKYTKESDEIQGIKVYGVNLESAAEGADGKKIPKKDYYISKVTVSNNTIVTAGYGIHLIDAKNCTITNNKITGKGVKSNDPLLQITNYDGIYLTAGSSADKINNNTISGMIGYGIDIYSLSECTKEISGNTITDCKDGGMLINASSTVNTISKNKFNKVTGDSAITVYNESKVKKISNNKIYITGAGAKNNNTHGIKLTTGAECGTISGNTIQTDDSVSAAKLGIGIIVYSNSKVTGSISKNTISKAKEYGISITTDASVSKNIEGNTIKDVQKSGIFVYSGSSVGGNISKNKVSNVSEDGILINAKAKVTGSIDGNEVTTAGKRGIFVYSESSVGGNISKNKVTGLGEDGILINASVTVKGVIDGNEISDAGKRGIFIYDEKGKTTVGGIKNNTISNAASYGVNLTSTTNDLEVSGNTVTNCGSHGLMIQPSSSAYTVTINDNTVKGRGGSDSAIHVVKGKVSMSGNTVSNAGYGLHIAKGVAGVVYMNTYGDGITNQIYIAGKNYTQTNTIYL